MIEDIRDIRAPLAIPVWWHWPLAIAVAALLSLAIVLLVRAWQKRRGAMLTPLERARQALLAAEAHARAGRANEWADIVAETLRGALASRLGADVLPQNTTELAKSPWAQPPLAEATDPVAQTLYLSEAPQLIELLGTCDLARFALASLDAEVLLAKTNIARELAERLLSPPPKPRTLPLRAVPVTP